MQLLLCLGGSLWFWVVPNIWHFSFAKPKRNTQRYETVIVSGIVAAFEEALHSGVAKGLSQGEQNSTGGGPLVIVGGPLANTQKKAKKW